MGRKKREKRKETAGKKGNKSKSNTIYLIGLSVVFIALVGYMGARSGEKVTTPSGKTEETTTGRGALRETGSVLPASIWQGSIAHAYEIAAKIPEVIDAQYCYCDCSKNQKFRHKSLLTCFTDDHGANCGICMNEVFLANKLYQEGRSIPEIVEAVDKQFSRYGRG